MIKDLGHVDLPIKYSKVCFKSYTSRIIRSGNVSRQIFGQAATSQHREDKLQHEGEAHTASAVQPSDEQARVTKRKK